MSYLGLERYNKDYEIIQGDLRPIVQKAVELFTDQAKGEPGMILRLAAGSELNFDLANLCVSSRLERFLIEEYFIRMCGEITGYTAKQNELEEERLQANNAADAAVDEAIGKVGVDRFKSALRRKRWI